MAGNFWAETFWVDTLYYFLSYKCLILISYTGSVAKIGFEIQVYSSILKDFPGKIQGFSWKNSRIFKDLNIHFTAILKLKKVINTI